MAKNRLVGEFKVIAGQDFLVQKNQIIVAAVTTKDCVKSAYVSVGYLILLGAAVKITKYCVCKSKIPEPIFASTQDNG